MCPWGCDKDKSPVWALIGRDALAHWPGGPDGEGAGHWSGESGGPPGGELDEDREFAEAEALRDPVVGA